MLTTHNHFFRTEGGLPDPLPAECTDPGEAGPPEAVYLRPGELFYGRQAARITTILGSCVAVTMYDRRRHAAAICHAVQPACRQEGPDCRARCGGRFKSVRCAVDEMLRRMDWMGASRSELEIKIFGGATVLGERRGVTRLKSVGRQNVEAARLVLAEQGLPVRVTVAGGSVGRKIIFDTCNGAVFLKRIASIRDNPNLFARAHRG